jgi:hypothetical protein
MKLLLLCRSTPGSTHYSASAHQACPRFHVSLFIRIRHGSCANARPRPQSGGAAGAHLLLLAGRPLDQDVVWLDVHVRIAPAVHVAHASTYLQAAGHKVQQMLHSFDRWHQGAVLLAALENTICCPPCQEIV